MNPGVVDQRSSSEEKIRIFRSLFRGREDVYPRRFESRKTGRAGYAPACANEWVRGVCEKPRIKCAECPNRRFLPVTDDVIRWHLSGRDPEGQPFVAGVYPLLLDETCFFLAVDFDKSGWQADASAFLGACHRLGVPAALERSRSGRGGHVWLFFDDALPAALVRRLGSHLLTEAMEGRPDIGLDSYDRLFPNQDTLPQGGFGNLIALPLQKRARDQGNSVFLDDDFVPWPDQWAFLASARRIGRAQVEALVQDAERRGRILGVRLPPEDDDAEPWTVPPSRRRRDPPLTGVMPSSLELVLGNQIYVAKEGLSPQLRNRLLRLAAFQNPEFYKAQAMRLSTYNKPRVIACAEDHSHHIALPRGCLDDIQQMLEALGIRPTIRDERVQWHDDRRRLPRRVATRTESRRRRARGARHRRAGGNHGVRQDGRRCVAHRTARREYARPRAPAPASRSMDRAPVDISRRAAEIHRPHRRWTKRAHGHRRRGHHSESRQERRGRQSRRMGTAISSSTSATTSPRTVSNRWPGKRRRGSFLDCPRPSLARTAITPSSSCSAVRFDTASTPRHRRLRVRSSTTRWFSRRPSKQPATPESDRRIEFQTVYRELVEDDARNQRICDDVVESVRNGRSPLVLTERNEHLDRLERGLADSVRHLVALRAGLGKKQRQAIADRLASIPGEEPRVILATGKYVGEGFDDSRLDTLFLTLPVSWRGTIAQYAGRLHRLHDGKREVRVYDYADLNVPMLARMFDRRCRGYEAIGYTVLLPASAIPGWPADVVLPSDPCLETRLLRQRAPAGEGWRRFTARESLRSRGAASAARRGWRPTRAQCLRGISLQAARNARRQRRDGSLSTRSCPFRLMVRGAWRSISYVRTLALQWSWMVRSISPTGSRTGAIDARISCFRRAAISCCGFWPKTSAGIWTRCWTRFSAR